MATSINPSPMMVTLAGSDAVRGHQPASIRRDKQSAIPRIGAPDDQHYAVGAGHAGERAAALKRFGSAHCAIDAGRAGGVPCTAVCRTAA